MAYGVLNDPQGKIDLNHVIANVLFEGCFVSLIDALNNVITKCEIKLKFQVKVLLEELKGLNPEEAISDTSNSYVAWNSWA